MIEIQLNGTQKKIDPEISVLELLQRLELRADMVAVELNRRVITKAEYPNSLLKPGDQVEIVTFVGGG